MKNKQIGYYFIVMASIIIVLAGIKSASEIIVPFLLSLFIAIILSPLFEFLKRKKINDAFAVVITLSLFTIILVLVAKFIGSSANDFRMNIGNYEEQLSRYFIKIDAYTTSIGLDLAIADLPNMLSTTKIMLYTSSFMQSIGSFFSNGFVIILTVVFMLLESKTFLYKINFFDPKAIYHINEIFSKIKNYMMIKSLMSFMTGFIVWIALSIIGTDYAFLWALLTFLLNFIPNIGSIIAAVPPVILTLIQLGSVSALVVMVTFVAINIIIGSIIEPKVMGKGLGLSTLIVFLSLLFWGWLLGMVGMLLSIPLTIIAKIILDTNENTKWMSVMLGTGENLQEKK